MPNAPEVASTSSGEPSARLDVRVVLAAVSLALLVFPFGLTLLLVEDRWAPLLRLDRGARDSLHRYAVARPGFVAAMQLISNSGSGAVWAVVLTLSVGWLLWRRLPRLALFVVITAAGSSLLNVMVKTAVHRLRPVLADPVARARGLSFPSAHAQGAVAGYEVLLLVLVPILYGPWRRVVVTYAVLAVLAIGFSRIALGVHYPSDVWGGFMLGSAWVAAMAAAFNVTAVNRQRRAVATSGRSADGGQSLGGTRGR
jgi:membrane-associated phospholipid phosphatase